MSNSMINKLKIIDNSRQRLKNILESKDVAPSSNSLPALVESVNYLYKKDYKEQIWNGLNYEPEPNYFVPGFDFNSVYENDVDKANYTGVVLFLINVNNSDVATLPQNAINSGQKYKFSDTQTLQNPARNTESPSHTWDKSKDIVGTDGCKYRWILVYTNSTTSIMDYQGAYLIAEAMIVFKGTFAGIGWRDNYSAPKYTEIKPGVIVNGGLSRDDSSAINTNPRTVIINADVCNLNHGIFWNCINLEYVRITCEPYTSDLWSYQFSGCESLKYVKINKCPGWYENTFNGVTNCYIEVGEMTTTTGYERADRYPALSQTEGIRLKIGTINGDLRYLAGNRDGLAHTKNSYVDIDTINGSISGSAFSQDLFRSSHVKIGTVNGGIGSYAFNNCILAPEIKIGSINSADYTIGEYAFTRSTIQKVDMTGSRITSIGNNCFENCQQLNTLTIGEKVVSLGNYFITGCVNLHTLNIPDGVKSLSELTFIYSELQNVNIGNGITALPTNLFRYVGTIQSVALPDTLQSIGSYCFAYCTDLKEILLPANIDTIPEYAFYRSGIQKVSSVSPIKYLNRYAFAGCKSLTEFDMSGLEEVQTRAFEGTNITNFKLPKSLTAYDTESFAYIHKHLDFDTEFVPSGNISLAGTDIHDENILDTLYKLPDLTGSTSYTITMYPTMYNGSTTSGYRYYYGIINRTITVNANGIVWDDSGSQTVAQYVASKNWTIV